jgi:Tocopherol cyclase
MEGYYWRVTDPRSGQVVVALCGVNRAPDGDWGSVALAAQPGGYLRESVVPSASASRSGMGVAAGTALRASADELTVDLAPDARLSLRLRDRAPWPHRALGGLGVAQVVPGVGQYWHPHVLGARVEGHAVLGDRTVDLDGATAYAEKNWGAGFPRRWWWGQAQGFDDPDVCVAFAGGVLERGPLTLAATSVLVHLGDGETLRLVPPTAFTTTHTGDSAWRVNALSPRHRITIEGDSGGTEPHLLPVPIPAERRTVDRARQYLAGRMRVEVHTGRRLRYRGESRLAGLELGDET